MSEKRQYTDEEIEALAEQASKNAMNHFKYGVSCGECTLKGFLDLGLTDFPAETVALASGFGAGMGASRHTCGAVNGGMLIIGTTHGRRDPYALPTFEDFHCKDRARKCKRIIGFCAKQATKAALKDWNASVLEDKQA